MKLLDASFKMRASHGARVVNPVRRMAMLASVNAWSGFLAGSTEKRYARFEGHGELEHDGSWR
jgi:hypothetical protein